MMNLSEVVTGEAGAACAAVPAVSPAAGMAGARRGRVHVRARQHDGVAGGGRARRRRVAGVGPPPAVRRARAQLRPANDAAGLPAGCRETSPRRVLRRRRRRDQLSRKQLMCYIFFIVLSIL